MKILLSFLFCAFSIFAFAQPDIKIFAENKDKGYKLFASNNEACPVSLSIDLDLTNLTFSHKAQKIFVIPAKSEKWELGDLDVISATKGLKYSYQYIDVLGDVTLNHYDTGYQYDLPIQKGTQSKVFQGYNGIFSHQNENSLDFSMEEGTPILAAREGIVVSVVQSNTLSCPREECNKYNNIILICHPDGTFSLYAHLQYNGSKVKVGDTVKKGDVIGYSGNTGWSSGPHLHFTCSLPSFDNKKSIRTLFKINDGSTTAMLQEGSTYTRNY